MRLESGTSNQLCASVKTSPQLKKSSAVVRPRERFYIFRVRLGPLAFLGRALRLGHSRGLSAAVRKGLGAGSSPPLLSIFYIKFMFYMFDVRLAPLSGPS